MARILLRITSLRAEAVAPGRGQRSNRLYLSVIYHHHHHHSHVTASECVHAAVWIVALTLFNRDDQSGCVSSTRSTFLCCVLGDSKRKSAEVENVILSDALINMSWESDWKMRTKEGNETLRHDRRVGADLWFVQQLFTVATISWLSSEVAFNSWMWACHWSGSIVSINYIVITSTMMSFKITNTEQTVSSSKNLATC